MNVLRMGVIGVSGFFQKKIAIPVSKSPLITFTAIASRSKEKAEEAAEAYGIARAYDSYEALLSDPEVDAVYLPLPNHLHAPYIKKAAQAGKHVLCEKPIALNAEEAADCLAFASSQGIRVMEAFMYRFHPQWQYARELILMNEIGSLQSIEVHFAYKNTDPGNIRNQPESGGGALMDVGCYAVSVSRFLTGREPQRVVSLFHHDPEFRTDILSSGMLDFGMARSTFTVGTASFPHQYVHIYGSSGMMSIEIPFNTYSDVEARLMVSNSIGSREVIIPPEDQYILEFEAFAQAIFEKSDLPIPAEDAISNMRVLDALRISAKKGGWVMVGGA